VHGGTSAYREDGESSGPAAWLSLLLTQQYVSLLAKSAILLVD